MHASRFRVACRHPSDWWLGKAMSEWILNEIYDEHLVCLCVYEEKTANANIEAFSVGCQVWERISRVRSQWDN